MMILGNKIRSTYYINIETSMGTAGTLSHVCLFFPLTEQPHTVLYSVHITCVKYMLELWANITST